MRLRPAALLLLLLSACAPAIRIDVPVTAPPPEQAPAGMDLACFAHPVIDQWERRLRVERPLSADTARVLGKRPGAVRIAAMRGLRRLAAHPQVRASREAAPTGSAERKSDDA